MHKPVLLKEVIKILDIQPTDKVLDGTVGGGGYFKEICHWLGEGSILLGLDQDETVIEKLKDKISCDNLCQRYLKNENFRNLDKVLNELGLKQVNKIVFDLGFSSDQLTESGRGFSFQKNEPLMMTLKSQVKENDLTAFEIVNYWEEESLVDILEGYGEERFAKKIARNICQSRKQTPLQTTFDLVEIIKQSVPLWYQHKKIHYATKTFQALRIAVNDEMGALEEGLQKGFEYLEKKGRMAVVSFHSKEDRVVKNFFKDKKNKQECVWINKKPIVPMRNEVLQNPRARSAKLRAVEKL